MTRNEIVEFFKLHQLSEFYKLESSVAFRKSDEKIVALIFNEDELIFEIDGIAMAIFEGIADQVNLIDHLLKIQEGKDWDKIQFGQDCASFIKSLLENKLITVGP